MYGLLGEVVFDFRRKTSHMSFVLFHIICKNVVEYILFIITTVQVTNAYIIYVINRAKIKPFYDIHEKKIKSFIHTARTRLLGHTVHIRLDIIWISDFQKKSCPPLRMSKE